MTDNEAKYIKRLDRERSARLQAEELLESKSRELFETNQRLLELTRNLESEVKQRTEDLKMARDHALASAKAKSEFLANMSHELRTPLNGVIGMLYSLRNCENVVQQKALIQTAMDSSKLLMTVINDILEFSKIESVGVELERIHVDVRECIESIAHSFAVSARSKRLDLFTVIDPRLPRLFYADGFRIQQIVGNFISNAIKFTDYGWIKVQVDYLGAGRVLIKVKDTGVGIDKEQSSRIFSAFSQADNSVTRKFGGTGLGLSICNAIAKAMGSDISLKSKLGEGAEFSFLLNLDVVDEYSIQSSLYGQKTRIVVAVITDSELTGDVFKRVFSNQPSISVKVYDSSASFRALGFTGTTPTVVFIDVQGAIAEEIKSGKNSFQFDGVRSVKLLHYDQLGEKNIESDLELLKPLRSQEVVDAVFQPEMLHKVDARDQSQRAVFHDKRVLVVDDNIVNLQVAENILQDFGLCVETAKNGQEAIDIVKSHHFDMVFMDVQMPVKDGLTAVKELRASGHGQDDLPIIAMTAHASKEDRVKSLAAGMNDHVTKPLDPSQLELLLINYFGSAECETVIPMQEATSAEVISLPSLKGFNFTMATTRLNGNVGLLRKLLLSFCDMYENAGPKLSVLLQQAEYDEITVMAHQIKGSGANLGADAIASAAAAIENAVKSNRTESLPDLVREFGLVNIGLSDLRDLLQQSVTDIPQRDEPNRTTESVGREQVAEMLEAIKHSLNVDYTECENLVASLSRFCSNSKYSVVADKVSLLFSEFEYDQLEQEIEKFAMAC